VTAMDHPKVWSLIDNFLDRIYPHDGEGVNLAVENINCIFDYLATLSNLKSSKKIHKTKDNEQWFDLDCKTMRKKIRQLSNQKHSQPNDADLRHQYCEEPKQYKNTLRKKREQ